MHGDAGQAWLDVLSARIADYEQRWAIKVASPFANLSYNYVAPALRSDGAQLILKLGMPHPELSSEIAALRLYDGNGSARLIEAEPERGALLIERLLPGSMLLDLTDDGEATRIAAQVMRALWRPASLAPDNAVFPTAARWTTGLQRLRATYDGGTGPLPEGMVQRAEALFADLLASSGAPVLLHGDLHHENILSAERAPWLAIDPKGLIGEPEYEVGALMRNPLPRLLALPDVTATLARRFDILAEILGFDRPRMIAWSWAQAILSAWWHIEDHGHGWEPTIALAERLTPLLP
ncbi:MAG TPA: aminoglycoside phosphotransferase family protein [Ktedonobacterales bacterium]